MANSNQTKQAIRMAIRKLDDQKRQMKKQIDELKVKRDRFVSRMDTIDQAIAKLEADLNG